MSVLLETRQLGVNIANLKICRDLNFTLTAGQCWAILGTNGVGKTTLLHTLAGLRDAQQGEIYLKQKNLHQYSKRELAQLLGVLFQGGQDAFPSTVMETTLIGRHPYTKSWQWESAGDFKIANESLKHVGLEKFITRQVDTLSGGERQRLAVATLLTQTPQLYLLDEPTNHLDLQFQHAILQLFQALSAKQQGATLMVLHDINLAANYCDHVLLLMGNGNYLSGTTEALLTEENLSHLYNYPIQKIHGPNGPVFIAQSPTNGCYVTKS